MIRRLLFYSLAVFITGCNVALNEEKSTHDKFVLVAMETELGRIEIEVFPESAPATVKNFLAYVDGGHLDGGAFYRTVSPANDNNPHAISVIQGGINATMSTDFEAPFPPIAHETTEESGLKHVDGAISMARGAPGTAQSEFFISIGDNHVLDHGGPRYEDGLGFAVFGRVRNGLDVARAIHERPADGGAPDDYVKGQVFTDPVKIVSVTRIQESH